MSVKRWILCVTRNLTQDRRCQPHGGAREKVKESGLFLLWNPWMPVESFMAMRQRVDESFGGGRTNWSQRHTTEKKTKKTLRSTDERTLVTSCFLLRGRRRGGSCNTSSASNTKPSSGWRNCRARWTTWRRLSPGATRRQVRTRTEERSDGRLLVPVSPFQMIWLDISLLILSVSVPSQGKAGLITRCQSADWAPEVPQQVLHPL